MGCVQSSAQTHPEGEAEVRSLQALGFSHLSAASDAAAANKLMPAKHNAALRQCAIHGAALAGDVAAAQWLQQKGADLRARNSYDQSPLMLALQRGHVPLAAFLYEATTSPGNDNTANGEGDLASCCSGGSTALHLAAQQRRTAAVAWTLSKLPRSDESDDHRRGAIPSVDLPDNHGDTPLLLACASGDVDACTHLWAHSKLNPKNTSGANTDSQTMHTSRSNYHGSDMSANSSNRSLEGGSAVDLVVSCAGLSPLPLHVNVDGSTLVHYACLSGDPAVLHWLFGSALQPTALAAATSSCSQSPQQKTGSDLVLLGAGASPASPAMMFVSDSSGRTPLQLAAAWGHVGCCAALIAWGALTSSKSNDRADLHVLNRDIPMATPESLATCISSVEEAAMGVPGEDEKEANDSTVHSQQGRPNTTGDRPLVSSSSSRRSSVAGAEDRQPLVPGPPMSAAAAACLDVRGMLHMWAASELTFADAFVRDFLAGTLKPAKKAAGAATTASSADISSEQDSETAGSSQTTRSTATCYVAKLRKPDRKTRHVPRVLIAEFAGVCYGRRKRLIREALELLTQPAPPPA